MQIRFIQSISGHADERYGLEDCSFAPGQCAEIHDTLAGHWIAAGIAEAVKPAKTPKAAKATQDSGTEGK
jgi:hypothetical protein